MLGFIGGSGFYNIALLEDARTQEIKTQYGVVPVLVGMLSGSRVAFLCRHGAMHQTPPHKIDYRANIDALCLLGVTHIIATNAVGGISENTEPGALIIPDQIIDYTWGREHTFFDAFSDQLDHVEFAEPLDEGLRNIICQEMESNGQALIKEGVYGCKQGPRFETAAEIQKLKRDGCDVVGMTLMPEAALARERGVAYASICFSVNWAAGIDKAIDMEEIGAHLKRCTHTIQTYLPLLAVRI